MLVQAEQNGVGTVAKTRYDAAVEVGLHVRPWAKSIMFAPPAAKKRCLLTVWTDRRQQEPGVAKAYIAPEAFEQFYGIMEADLAAAFGIGPVGGWVVLDRAKAERMPAGLRTLLGGKESG